MIIAIISMIRDSWGGSEELWAAMAKEALQKGHKVIHLRYKTKEKHIKIYELEKKGLITFTRPGYVPNTSPTKRSIYIGFNFLKKKVINPIKKVFAQSPDIVIYNGTCYSIANEKNLLHYLQSKPSVSFYIIGHLANDLIRSINDQEAAVIRLAYSRCRKVFFVSKKNLETAKRHLCTEINNAEIIRNPVNLSTINYIPYPQIKNVVHLATIGNLATIHKGQDMLIEALSKWDKNDWILNIYGQGYDELYLKQLVHHFKLEDKIVFHGSINDVRSVWEKNHLLVLPSHMEGMPLVVVEAMLCGRVCVATDVGGNKEWIQNNKSGFIAPAATIAALIEALETAWENKENWEEIGQAAHEAAMELYDPKAGITLLNRIIAK